MKADELIDKSNEEIGGGFTRFGVRLLMKEYARQKCKEQRSICADQFDCYFDYDEGVWHVEEDEIKKCIGAPEPEFD